MNYIFTCCFTYIIIFFNSDVYNNKIGQTKKLNCAFTLYTMSEILITRRKTWNTCPWFFSKMSKFCGTQKWVNVVGKKW